MGDAARVDGFRLCREVLWALDAAGIQNRPLQIGINFVRYLGGPIHTMMRRYRFVQEGLCLGVPETALVEDDARQHVRLWHRVEQDGAASGDDDRYKLVLQREEELLMPGMARMLQEDRDRRCKSCQFRLVYGAESSGRFGGVQLCMACREEWQDYLEKLPSRAATAFPTLSGLLKTTGC
jgi:hypothetical protein